MLRVNGRQVLPLAHRLTGWALLAATLSGKEAVTPARVLDTATGSYDPELGLLHYDDVVRTAAAGVQTGDSRELQRFQQASDRAAALSVLHTEALAAAADGEPRRRIPPTPLQHRFERTRRAFFEPACA